MKKSNVALLLALVLIVLVGCKPYDVPEFVEIASNETAFIVPLSGKTSSQAEFMSEQYLRENMVATKRVEIPHEWIQTGKKTHMGKYLPTIKIVRVDRTPVSVMWDANNSQTKIAVETKESIGFTIPISITAMIEQTDAPKFLYKYTENKTLSSVVNTDVNAFIKTQASQRFGVYTFEECKLKKKEILEAIFTEAKLFFKDYGITLSQFGMTDGLIFDNVGIQQAVDKQILLQAEGKALKEKEINAQIEREIALKNAQNEARIANEKASTVKTLMSLQEVENSRIRAEAEAEAIKIAAKSVQLPSVLPEGLFMQLGLDKYVPSAR